MSVAFLCLLASHHIGFRQWASEFSFVVPSSITVISPSGEDVDWQLLLPVRAFYDNMLQDVGPVGLGVDTLLYTAVSFADCTEEILLIPGENGVPMLGTFYLATGMETLDTLYQVNPLHTNDVIQISLRPDDTYIGYLYELINTPFIMAPRRTPDGSQQSDNRLGTDCAGLAVYGKRRQGFDYLYLGPRGITDYLVPLGDGSYKPDTDTEAAIFRNDQDCSVSVGEEGLCPGDILHFGAQVSIFLEDRGISGVLDSQDMVIQSWFNGPHVCTIEENGFFGLPVKFYRWPQ
ncbi:MAG: hypothetical protein K8S62_07540 [Candidatus Sabulitectum sp.]|nr:hypothetical protein [Candidatus Sabulitectum sp.]